MQHVYKDIMRVSTMACHTSGLHAQADLSDEDLMLQYKSQCCLLRQCLARMRPAHVFTVRQRQASWYAGPAMCIRTAFERIRHLYTMYTTSVYAYTYGQ